MFCTSHILAVDPIAKTYSTDESFVTCTQGKSESKSDFPSFRNRIFLRASSICSSTFWVAGGHSKAEYTISGCSGRVIMEARTEEVGDMDGGACESTVEPVLSCGSS